MKYNRVLLKLSGEALAGKGGERVGGIDREAVAFVTGEIDSAIEGTGAQIAIVVGGGNILRGARAEDIGVSRVTGDFMGMLATMINALALQAHLEAHGLVTRLMTAMAANQVAEPYIRRRAIRHLEKGRVVILAGGTGNPFFSTDTAAVLRAAEIGANVLLKGTSVDGVYTADPKLDSTARFLPELNYKTFLDQGLGVMDMTAVQLARERKLPIVVFNIWKPGALLMIIRGEGLGSLIAGE
ncbi:MAG: UMP kinase [candidate division WOR-3 bacterium]